MQNCNAQDVADPGAREARLRSCFETQVWPALRRGETSEPALAAAADAFLGWLREVQLTGASDQDFAAEHERGRRSLTIGLRNAYSSALAQCRRAPGPVAAARLAGWAHRSYLFGWSEDDPLFPTFDEDFRQCQSGKVFRITVRSSQRSERLGTLSDITYRAIISGGDDELTGTGTYAGFVVSMPNATPDGTSGRCTLQGTPRRFSIGGQLDASGSMLDLSALGGSSGLTYILATTDWPLKPIFLSPDDAFARTAEEREGVKGSGTVARLNPLPLTGTVTEATQTETSDGGVCAGTITDTETIRVQRGAR